MGNGSDLPDHQMDGGQKAIPRDELQGQEFLVRSFPPDGLKVLSDWKTGQRRREYVCSIPILNINNIRKQEERGSSSTTKAKKSCCFPKPPVSLSLPSRTHGLTLCLLSVAGFPQGLRCPLLTAPLAFHAQALPAQYVISQWTSLTEMSWVLKNS